MEIFDMIWEWAQRVSVLCAMCSAFVAATPTPADDKIWGKIYKYLDVFALNIGKAKDKYGV